MSDQTGGATSEQKLAALQNRDSNAAVVASIQLTGHAASTTVTAAAIGCGMAGAAGTGGTAAVACYAAPLATGIAGAIAGAALVNHLALDEKLLDFLGKPKLAAAGPQPATVGDEIAHSSPFTGALGGLMAGVVVGALCAAAAVAVVGTGGLAAPLLIGAAAGLGGGFAGALVNGFFSKSATVSGKIVTGSPDVFFEGKPVARVTDQVSCSMHSIPPQIVEGSETISANGLPLARIGHKTTCGATIQRGCSTITADNTTGQYGPIDSQMSVLEQSIVSLAEVGLCFSAVRFRSSKLGKKTFGEPIDPSDGSYVDFRTDFQYSGILPLALTRVYSGKDTVGGLLGGKWICNWSQRLVYDPLEATATLEDGDGEVLQFTLGRSPEFSSRNLKAPHYHLTGSRENARLFDSRSQRTLVFRTDANIPHTGVLASIEDRNNNRIDFIYKNSRLHSIEHSDGTVFQITTTQQGFISSVATHENGRVETIVSYRYDGSLLTDTESLFNGEFHYDYSKEGWLNHWHDSGITTVDLEYDTAGRVIATRTPDGMYNDRFIYFSEDGKTQYHDATGGCSTLWFNESGLPIKEQDPLGNITLHQYDFLDRKTATTDALGRTTTFDHDAFGNLTGETNWAARSTTLAWNEQRQITRIQYPDGTKAEWKYDINGNLIEGKEADGRIFRFSYDDNGRLISETRPDGTSSRLSYDNGGRLAAIRDPLGQMTAYHQDKWGHLKQITDPLGNSTRYEHERTEDNPRGTISRIIHPDGGEERFGYDKEGLLKRHIAHEGQTIRYRHGAFDLLREITDAKGCTTKLDYDKAARLKRVTNAAGESWTYGYNLAGQLVTETDWAGRQTSYDRDAFGRVIAKRLPGGVEQHVSWDELDRIIAVNTARQRISYEYDDSDRLIRAATFSNERSEPVSDVHFIYNGKGQLEEEIQNGQSIRYTYDINGRCIGRKSASGTTGYDFDLLGRFSGITSNGHTLGLQRNALGLETERTYQQPEAARDAFSLKQSYDPCGRLRSQCAGQARRLSAHEQLSEISRKYSWDKSGRLEGVQDNRRGTSNYRYDPRDQIERITRQTGLKSSTEERYSYDELMNITFGNGVQHRYEGGVVRTIGQTTYRYDNRGRTVQKKVHKNGFRPKIWHYRWDDFDRMVETGTPDGSVWRYSYDAFGRRIRKECVKAGERSEKQAIAYIWQGATLAEEITSSGETTRWHFEPGTFHPLAKETNGSFFPIVTDHLGTPKELFDAEGNILWQAEHALWGNPKITVKKTDNYQPIIECSLRFQNQWEDEESGLYYNLNRYYDPESGQYLSPDPVGLEGGLRTHGYVHDPMQWVDPLGLASCGKLPAKMGATFRGGKYSSRVLEQDIILYRVGTKRQPLGEYFSTHMPQSEIQARIDKAILPEWPGGGKSPIDTVFKIKIPKGTIVHTGEVASQGEFYVGGTQQVVIEKPWTIPGVEVIDSWLIVK